MKEETFDILVLDAFVLGKDVENGKGRKVRDSGQFLKNLRNVVFFLEFRFHEILEGVDPQVHLLSPVLLAQVHDVAVPVLGDVKVQQVVTHVQLSAQHHDPLVELIHLEQHQQMVVVRLLSRVLQIVQNLLAVFFPP